MKRTSFIIILFLVIVQVAQGNSCSNPILETNAWPQIEANILTNQSDNFYIVAYEYWFDNNYSSKIIVNINPQTIFSINTNIKTNRLSDGLHAFHIRFKDEANRWSSVISSYFYKTETNVGNSNSITGFEYWFDNNYSSKVSQNISLQQTFSLNASVKTNGLSDGLHDFHIRFKDKANRWSSVISSYFYKTETNVGSSNLITGYRYWFDTASNQRINVKLTTPSNPYVLDANINAQNLAPGNHTLNIQFKDIFNKWSSVVTDTFNIKALNIIYPKLSISASSINQGQNIEIEGTDFHPGGGAIITIEYPDGSSTSVNNISINSQGNFNYNFSTTNSMTTGFYKIAATDTISELTTSVKSFELKGTTTNSYLQSTFPTSGLSFSANQNINVEWTDKLVLGSMYPITGSKRGYKYTIQYSDNGGPWQDIGTVEGQNYIDNTVELSQKFSYKTASNNMKVRIVDDYNPSNVQESPSFKITAAPETNLQLEYKWDYSYPTPPIDVKGVAADGTARIFLDLSKINSSDGPAIESVSVNLNDNFNGTDDTKLGRVKVATQFSSYSSEANGIKTISATDNTSGKKDYIFWYVAPDDFVGKNPQDSVGVFRYVDANFSVSYSNGTTGKITKKIIIVRPPLMFVHGLGADGSIWNHFSSTALGKATPFIEDKRFITRSAVNLSPTASYKQNALQITIGNNITDPNTFRGVITKMRNLGFAANRVDYICHGTGGCVLRSIYDNYYQLFTRTGQYKNRRDKNYERGYVNKVIMLDVPNFGSPWADIASRYVDDLPCKFREAIEVGYAYSGPWPYLPFRFIQHVGQSRCLSLANPLFARIWDYQPTQEAKDLRVDGGVKFGITNTKAHLIAGDIFPGAQNSSNGGLIPQKVINIVANSGDDLTPKFLNTSLKIASNLIENPETKKTLKLVLKTDKNPVNMALDFLNTMAIGLDAFNIGTFIPESDLVVSVKSQLAGYSRPTSNTNSNVSIFDNFVGHAIIRPVTSNINVGNRVNYLLNSSLNSPLFNVIPATPSQKSSLKSDMATLNSNPIFSRIDTNKLKITFPQNNTSFSVDSILQIRIKVLDTMNLQSLDVYFQNKTYKIDSLILGNIVLNVQVNFNLLDSQPIVLEGFYSYPDSAVFMYDQKNVNISTKEKLTGFGVNPKIMYLLKNQMKYPQYYGLYQNFLANGNFSRDISAVVNDTSVVVYDSISQGFKGISEGETYAIVSYGGYSDTLYFVVGGCMGMEKPTITQSGDTLISSDGDFYYWSTGDTTKSIVPDASGDYSVTVSDASGCIGTSDTIHFTLINTGTANYINERFKIYPNPAYNELTIENGSQIKCESISIYNIRGLLLMRRPFRQTRIEINISTFTNGVYLVKINTMKGVIVKKFVKE